MFLINCLFRQDKMLCLYDKASKDEYITGTQSNQIYLLEKFYQDTKEN